MSEYSRRTVEDAVLAALQARLGDAVKTLKTCQGHWREDLRRAGWRLPAVLVELAEGRAEPVGLSSYDLILELNVVVVGRALRGEAAARREEGGVYDLLASVRQALWHQDREESLPAPREYAVYEVRFRTAWVQDF